MTTALVQPDRKVGLLDIGRRLDQLPVGRVHRKIVVAIGLGLFFEVYEIFLSSTIATALKTEYGFGGTALQLLMASSFVGMFFGAAAFGRIADKIGRRRAFLLNLVWFSVWSIIGAFAPSPMLLVGARFMAGIGVGAEYPVADSYLSDVLPKAHRGRLAAWAYTCSFLAVPALGFLTLSLNGRSVFGFDSWRVLLLVGAVGALFVIALRRGLPESPRWLAGWVGRKRRKPKCRPSKQVRVRQRTTQQTRTQRMTMHQMSSSRRRSLPGRSVRLSDCAFHPIGSVWSCSSCFICSSPSATTDSARWRRWCWSAAASTSHRRCCSPLCPFIGYPLGSLISIPLLSRFERKYVIMATVAVMAVCGMFSRVATAPALIVVFGLLTTAASNMFSNIYHVYQAEIFPSDVRATAVGWTYSVSRLSSAALPFILIPVLDNYGATAMFAVVIVALAATIAVLVPFGPRTTGRSLDEINPT